MLFVVALRFFFCCLPVFRGRKGHGLSSQLRQALLLSARQSNRSRIAPHLSFLFLHSPFLSPSSSYAAQTVSSTTEGHICNNCTVRVSLAPNVPSRPCGGEACVRCHSKRALCFTSPACRSRVRVEFVVFSVLIIGAVVTQACAVVVRLGSCCLFLFFFSAGICFSESVSTSASLSSSNSFCVFRQ